MCVDSISPSGTKLGTGRLESDFSPLVNLRSLFRVVKMRSFLGRFSGPFFGAMGATPAGGAGDEARPAACELFGAAP